jgi:RNA polymerase sigma factor (sigma-70 family)
MAASIAHVFNQLPCWTSDAALLERFLQQHDEAAFAALVARHGAMVLRLCRRILGDAHAAEDAFQAAFLILARKAHSLKQPDSLPAWLYGVARRVALKARTKLTRRSSESLDETLPDPHPDPLMQLSVRELLDILDAEVQRLPAAHRSVFVLCCLEGHTQEEAARILGCTPGSIKGRLERGRQRLQTRLQRRGIAISAALSILAVSRGEAAPPLLLQSTVRAALHGGIGTSASVLARSVLQAMFLSKLAAVTAVLVAVTLAASTTIALVYRGPAAEAPEDEKPAAAIKPKETDAGEPQTRKDALGDPLPDGAIARLGTVRFRHGEPIMFLSFTADGKRLVSQGYDGVRVWDGGSGKQLRRFALEDEAVGGAIDLSHDGKLLAEASRGRGKFLQLRDADSGRQLGILETKNPLRFRLSPDGKLLAVAANYPGGVELWDTIARKKLRAWQAQPPQYVEQLIFSADSRRLLTADGDKRMRLWDVENGRQLHEFPFEGNAGVLSPDGRFVAIIDANEKRESSAGATEWTARLRLWDAATGKLARTLSLPTHIDNRFSSLVFSTDGKRLITSGPDEFLRVWNPVTGEELRRLPLPTSLPELLALSPDGNTLAVVESASYPAIRIVDMAGGKERITLDGHRSYINAAALSPDGRTVVTNAVNDSLFVWDAATGQLRRKIETEQTSIQSLQFAPDGQTLLSGGWGPGFLYAWDLRNGKGQQRIEARPRANRIGKIIVTPDGKHVVRLDFDRTIGLFDAASGKQQQSFTVPGDAQLLGLALTPNTRSLVVWSSDRKVRLWDVRDGRWLREYSLPMNKESIPPGESRVVSFYHAALSPDGRLLAIGSQHNHGWVEDDQGKVVEGAKPEHYLMFLDLTTGVIAKRIDTVTSDASSLAFSPDDRVLAWSGYNDPTIRFVEVAGGRERCRLLGHFGFVRTLTFSADGNLLLSGSGDTTALIWDLGRRNKVSPAAHAETESLWRDLAGEDAARAEKAIRRLSTSPTSAIPFMRKRLTPVVPFAKPLAHLIADLDSDDFATRQRATEELAKAGDQALPAYRKALEGKPSLELRRRLEELLAKAGPSWWEASGERLRSLRAVEVLELAGTKESRELLATLASGAEGARLTEEAKAALERLTSRTRDGSP